MIDASSGRLDHIRRAHEPAVRWQDFERPAVRVSIPHQRNAGVRAARGDIIVFTDAGCLPFPGWLDRLVAPLRAGETSRPEFPRTWTARSSTSSRPSTRARRPTCGRARRLTSPSGARRSTRWAASTRFQYGSDVDFSWRLADLGYRIRCVPGAILAHDYGTPRRQRRRAYVYGKARARLYRKHRSRRRDVLRNDPLVVVYPLFLIGLPADADLPALPAVLIVPAWRNRSHGIIRVLIDHLWFGAGVLAELSRAMKILVLPREETNPYQELLYEEMRRAGRGSPTWRASPSTRSTCCCSRWRWRCGGSAAPAWSTCTGSTRSPARVAQVRSWPGAPRRLVRALAADAAAARAAAGLDRAQRAPGDAGVRRRPRRRRRLVAACDLVIAHSQATLDQLGELGIPCPQERGHPARPVHGGPSNRPRCRTRATARPSRAAVFGKIRL